MRTRPLSSISSNFTSNVHGLKLNAHKTSNNSCVDTTNFRENISWSSVGSTLPETPNNRPIKVQSDRKKDSIGWIWKLAYRWITSIGLFLRPLNPETILRLTILFTCIEGQDTSAKNAHNQCWTKTRHVILSYSTISANFKVRSNMWLASVPFIFLLEVLARSEL